jgi:hypothetical protein
MSQQTIPVIETSPDGISQTVQMLADEFCTPQQANSFLPGIQAVYAKKFPPGTTFRAMGANYKFVSITLANNLALIATGGTEFTLPSGFNQIQYALILTYQKEGETVPNTANIGLVGVCLNTQNNAPGGTWQVQLSTTGGLPYLIYA